VTGVLFRTEGLAGKQLELALQMVPDVVTIGFVVNVASGVIIDRQELEHACQKLGIKSVPAEVRAANDLDRAFRALSNDHVRAVINNAVLIMLGKTTGFCDFAGAGDESVLALCEGNDTRIVDAWRHRDTMHSVGKFLNWFRKLRLQGWDIGGDEGYGHQLMDRMAEQDFHLRRVNNGSQAERNDIYANLSAEWCGTVGQLIERRMIRIPNDEKLIAQLTSRRKLYDSRGREKLESKADLASRGVESPDRADALIGALMLGPGSDGYLLNPWARQMYLEMMEQLTVCNQEDPWRVDRIVF
jgi:hypothetical protein